MWHDYPFSQRNKAAEKAVGLGVVTGSDKEKGGMNKIWKMRGMQ